LTIVAAAIAGVGGMSQLIGVHGISQNYRWRQKIVDEWTSALTGGIGASAR